MTKQPNTLASTSWRTKALFLLFVLAGVVLVARLYTLQIVNGQYYAAIALGQQESSSTSASPRGNIYMQDKGGQSRYLVASNREMPMVYAVPGEVEDAEYIINSIHAIVAFDDDTVQTLFRRLNNTDSSFALIARQLTDEQARRVQELNLPGVYLRNEYVRFYPGEEVAAQSIGFVGFSGDERAGQYGVEQFYDDVLSGTAPSTSLDTLFGESSTVGDVELTIDYGVQFLVEQKLNELVERLQADSATALFMDPRTGAIIALANVPTFNPNTYSTTEDINAFSNPAVQGLFEPGSSFKPITIAAAIDKGVISPQTTYEDKGFVDVGGYRIANSDKTAHGVQTMTEVLEKSLNTGVIFAQNQLGQKNFRDYVRAFGFDKATGIDLPGEITGDVRNISISNNVNFATAAFGQGIAVSPIRLLASLSAIANGGAVMKPYIVSQIRQDGHERVAEPEKIAQPISSTTASRVTAMMVSAVENGFGKKAKVPGYTLAGKTGTAQVPNKDGPGYSDETIHTFVGFAPAYNPRFIGLVKVDNPKTIRFSADSIAPTFGELTSFILQYYNIAPQ
jgi:cell division protein FtsI/penicillin-binding protein 2